MPVLSNGLLSVFITYLHTENRDYTFTSQNVSFINSIRTQCLDVNISGSVGVVTNDLSFSLELSNADISVLGGSAEFNVTSTQIIIQDLNSKSNIYLVQRNPYLWEQNVVRYIGVAFIEGLVCTQTATWVPVRYTEVSFIQRWPEGSTV